MSTSKPPATLLMTIIHANAQNMFRCANLTPIFLTSPSSTNPSMATHVSWNGVFSYGMNKRLLEERRGRERLKRTKVNLPIVPPPLRGISMLRLNVCQSDWKMYQEEIEIVKTPKIELHPCSSFYLATTPSIIATINQTGNDSHDVARGKCSRAEKLDQDQDLFIEKISSSPWT